MYKYSTLLKTIIQTKNHVQQITRWKQQHLVDFVQNLKQFTHLRNIQQWLTAHRPCFGPAERCLTQARLKQ